MNKTDGRPSQILEPRPFDELLMGGRLDHRRMWLAIAELRNAPRRSHSSEVAHGSINRE